MDGESRDIEPLRQIDNMAAGEVYNVKHISRESGRQNDNQRFKKAEDDQDKKDGENDDSAHTPDCPEEIRDDVILSSEARKILEKSNAAAQSAENDNRKNGEKPAIDITA